VTTPSRTDTAPTEAVRANGLAKWWVRTPCSHAKRPSVSRATTRSGLASTTWGWTMTCRLEDGGEVLTPTARVSLPRVRDRSSVRVRVVGSSGVSRNGLVRPGAHARPSGSHRGVDPDARRAEPGRPVVDRIDEGSDDRLCPARQCGDHRYQGTFVVCQGWLSRTRSPRGRWPSSCRPCGQVSALRIDGELVSRWQVLFLTAVCTIGIALALRGARVGIWLLVALFAVGAATVNPLQHGLDALLDSPAARLGRELLARPDTGAVLNFWSGDISVRGGLTASGVDLVSGVNLYPNEKAWRVLDPDDSQRQAWNRYNNAIWSPGPPGKRAADRRQ
jgi:hypothetical protein